MNDRVRRTVTSVSTALVGPVRFLIVGLVSAATYMAILHAAVAGLGRSMVTGAVIAFLAGTIVSYVGNSLWTFGAPLSRRTLWRFWVVTGIGFLLNVAIAYVFGLLGAHHLLAGLVILIVVPAFNYLGHMIWTYR